MLTKNFLFRTLIYSVIGFFVVSLITMKINSPSDGNNVVGFPFKFYEYLGGKRIVELNREIIYIGNLLLDLGMAIALTFVIGLIIKKIKST